MSRGSVEQSPRVELFIHFDVVFTLGSQSPEDFGGEGEWGETVGGNDGSIAHGRDRSIELLTAITADVVADEILAVAGVETIIEQAAVGKCEGGATDCGNGTAEGGHGLNGFRDGGDFS